MKATYVGIDPGLDGAQAAIDEHGGVLWIADTPTLDIGNRGKVKRTYNAGLMASGLVGLQQHADVRVALEQIHSMPGQGVRSMFSMGFGLGLWYGLLRARGFRVEWVPPQRWKRAMLDGIGKEKDASRVRAMELFPTVANQLGRKKDHGRAEALLMAEYLRRTHAGRLTETP